jgi:nitroimidazol reductase NimA-like FMN-containing flavoprotein (pyridoxamine 5'-phosphate oxidase superfamily)
MDREFGLLVIDKARFAILTLTDENNEPYSIPVSPSRVGNSIYIHSALEGRKIDLLKSCPKVTLVFVGDVHVPDPITGEEFDKYDKENRLGQLVSTKFTTEYESAVVKGEAVFMETQSEKIEGLRAISQKYTPLNMKYFDAAAGSSISRTCVIRIDILEITAKRKKYDAKGEEMKWGRMG